MWRVAALLVCIAAAAQAQTDQRVAGAVQDWLKTHDAKGVVAVQQPDGETRVYSLGLPSDLTVDLASLSKAITAMCASELVRTGALRWDDPVSNYVAGFQDLRVGDLVTHQSGVIEDATQTYMSAWLHDRTHRAADIVAFMKDRAAPLGPVGAYAYSNDNYALLANVIEAASGGTYQDTCHALAIAPTGAVAVPSPRSGAFLSWGGWAMSVADYLRFHHAWYPTDAATLPAPAADLGGGAVYGLGMFARVMQGGSNHWHFGALCFPDHFESSTYVVAFFNGWRVMTAYDVCVDWPDMVALDNAIVDAVFAD